jgi:uncharacterized repeat protein (TIGR01451 family)
VTEPSALVVKQAGPATLLPGIEQEFKLEVGNRGPTEIRDLMVTDTLPENLELVAADGATYDRASRKLQWKLPTLASGQSSWLVFRAVFRGTEAVMNRVTAHAAGAADIQLHSILRPGQQH